VLIRAGEGSPLLDDDHLLDRCQIVILDLRRIANYHGMPLSSGVAITTSNVQGGRGGSDSSRYPSPPPSASTIEYTISALETASTDSTQATAATDADVHGGILDMILSPVVSGLLGPQLVKLVQRFLVYFAAVVPSRVAFILLGTPEKRPFVLIWEIMDVIMMVCGVILLPSFLIIILPHSPFVCCYYVDPPLFQ
jgi:hypothetical protein